MIRKNKKFIDPRYFMDEKMELKEGALGFQGPAEQSVNESEPEPEKYPDRSEPYDPFYNDDVEVDNAKLAADMKNALKYFSADQIVSSLASGLEYMGRPGKEAFIEISKIFEELGKPHHGKHQDI
tara:strand:+ start:686 stop:1060 length:375 start_codon:yes stop_codon:yes gene_type:complete